MSPVIQKTLSTLVQRWLGRLLRPYNAIEYANRLEALGQFLHVTMRELDSEHFHEHLVILEGEVGINYFNLPSGDIPRFNYVIFEQHLYFHVADIRGAPWEEARARGVSRPDWELYQEDLASIEKEVPELPYTQGTIRP